jgi:hypothetical protein
MLIAKPVTRVVAEMAAAFSSGRLRLALLTQSDRREIYSYSSRE